VSSQKSWFCDGQPKDGKSYPNCSGVHESYENFGPDCLMCGLPKEAMVAKKGQQGNNSPQATIISQPSSPLPSLAIAGLVLLAALGVGFGAWKVLQNTQETGKVTESSSPSISPVAVAIDPQALVSSTAVNAQLISQGEKILSSGGQNIPKTAGAAAFAQKNWDEAIAQYQQATIKDPNDPEVKIYLNNAKAKKAGNPLTMAVAVPLTPSPDAAKEVLRGVAQAQDKFNQSPPTPNSLLEVVIVNDIDSLTSASLAQDLIKSPNVLAVLGHGVDNGSRQAIALYEQAGLAALSPISTSIIPGTGSQSTLKTISLAQKANELLSTYLKTVGETLAKYASKKHSPASVVVFYNSDSNYSQQLKQQFVTALSQVNGKVVKEVDITAPGFNAGTELTDASKAGANIAVLALSKNKVDTAVTIAQANTSGNLQLLGGDELYNPTILVSGGNAIKGIVLAVPWSSQPNDPFAKQAASIWKGRVSWRTATAYDATQALATALNQSPTRNGVAQQLNQGIAISGTATDFNIFKEVPLVKAVPGSNGPPGSKYQFDPI